jgi:hypothetical protein
LNSPAARRVLVALSDRRRWYALMGSVLGGVLVGVLLWSNGSRDGLARDLVRHVALEPGAMTGTAVPADPAQVQDVLRRTGVRLSAAPGRVSYARVCLFRDHAMAHLVLQMPREPVTVLVLPEEKAPRPVEFQEQGYVGTIRPIDAGSLAVIGGSRSAVDEVVQQVRLLPLPQ